MKVWILEKKLRNKDKEKQRNKQLKKGTPGTKIQNFKNYWSAKSQIFPHRIETSMEL